MNFSLAFPGRVDPWGLTAGLLVCAILGFFISRGILRKVLKATPYMITAWSVIGAIVLAPALMTIVIIAAIVVVRMKQ